MTPAALLREQAARREQEAVELRALADRLDAGAQQARPATKAKPESTITTNVAANRANRTPKTIRLWAGRYGIGKQAQTGEWQISERALDEFLRKEKSENVRDVRNVPANPVGMFAEPAHLETEER